MINSILFYVTIWYTFWFLFGVIAKAVKVDLPHIGIGKFDLLGNNIITFIPSFLYQVHFWLNYFGVLHV